MFVLYYFMFLNQICLNMLRSSEKISLLLILKFDVYHCLLLPPSAAYNYPNFHFYEGKFKQEYHK